MGTDPKHIVVVAGAGASRLLGEGDSPMPLMEDWAISLRQDLEEAEPGYAHHLGLVPDVTGEEFEIRLGEFLAFQKDLDLVQQLRFLGCPNIQTMPQAVDEWIRRARTRSANIVEVIRANLFRSFGYPAFNDGLAYSAYKWLLDALSPDPPMRVAG